MSELSIPPRKKALNAALRVFARYGYRRTSMADIAKEGGLSRPALYQWFDNKEALFRALCENLKDGVLLAAAEAWMPDMTVEDGLNAAILAKDLPLMRLLHASPHGAELFGVDAALTAATAQALESGFAAILAAKIEAVREARGLRLDAFGSPRDFGAIVARLAGGLKHEAGSEDAYVDGVRRLCRITAAALRA